MHKFRKDMEKFSRDVPPVAKQNIDNSNLTLSGNYVEFMDHTWGILSELPEGSIRNALHGGIHICNGFKGGKYIRTRHVKELF